MLIVVCLNSGRFSAREKTALACLESLEKPEKALMTIFSSAPEPVQALVAHLELLFLGVPKRDNGHLLPHTLSPLASAK
jgi:hypothetical protein